jgi:hypothetical protein
VHHLNTAYEILYFCIVIILSILYSFDLFNIILSLYLNFGCMEYIICMYVSTYVPFTSVSSHWLPWIGYGITVGLILALLPLTWTYCIWNKLKDRYEEQEHIPEPSNKYLRFLYKASHKVVLSPSIRTVLYLVVCISLTVCTMLELVGPFARTCNIQTIPCKFNSHVDTLTVQCYKQPARVLNTEQLKTHGHWKISL